MKTAFLTEMGFHGQIPTNHPNMRTEFAWMATLQSEHFNVHEYEQVKGFDVVFIIFPKATVKLNRVGVEMVTPGADKDISIYSKPVVETLKKNNGKVCNVQEGPSDFFTDYDLPTQFHFYNQLVECDILFAHNEYDVNFYKGLFPQTKVVSIPSLIYPINIPIAGKENQVIIGGNFCSWYNGFQSYITATEFNCPIFVPSMHCKRKGEEQVPNLKHLPYMNWTDWMHHLQTYKYAVHLMPTIAAGTFSLNCAYHGIPCIGNGKVDTQTYFFPELSIEVNDIHAARFLAIQLRDNKDFYEHISYYAKSRVKDSLYANPEKWLIYITHTING